MWYLEHKKSEIFTQARCKNNVQPPKAQIVKLKVANKE